MKCHIDIETYSETHLKQAGVYRYAEDPTTEILCFAYAFDDGPIHIWYPGKTFPKAIADHAESGGEFRAHNAQFERVILNGAPGRAIGFPATEVSQWVCTAAKAAEQGMPRDLQRLGKALETVNLKSEDGKGEMLQLAKPRRPTKNNPSKRWLKTEYPEKYNHLYRYCRDDVACERDCDDALQDLVPNERKVYLLDQKINDRGIRIDQEAVIDVQWLIAIEKKRMAERCKEITGFAPTQTAKLAEWVRSQGVKIANLQAETVRKALKRPDLPANVRTALRIRSQDAMKAPAKYTAMERSWCADGALRGMFKFYGASTGRWSSLIVQLQNLFRPIIDDPDVAIEIFKERDLDLVRLYFPEAPMAIFASTVRGMLIARPGRDIIAADFSSIEARIAAWLSDALEKLEIFSTHGLVYEHTASKIWDYPLDVDSLKAFKKEHGDLRFLGKIAELALGYQGGQAAFVSMGQQYGRDIATEDAEKIKWDWRGANPEIVTYWDTLQNAAGEAIVTGEVKSAGRIKFKVVGDWLYMRVPSGRRLAYYKPEWKNKITFMGIDTYTGIWKRCDTYGGKLLQNACEAIARDLMVAAMVKLDKTGRYPILGSVHDEIIVEPAEGEGSVEEVVEIMCDKPSWAEDLPVAADGFRAKRYRK